MKILILGGNRYFGKRLAKNLAAKGNEVTILTRGNVNPEIPGILRLKGDRTNLESMQTAIGEKKYDVVVDNICMTAKDAKISLKVFAGKTSQYLMTSTLSIYPFRGNMKETDYDPRDYKPIPVKDPWAEYSEGKRAAEQVFFTKAPFKVAILRIPVIVGEDDYTRRLQDQVLKVKNGEPIYIPNREGKMSFLRSEDAAQAMQWLIENHKEGIYNFSSADTISQIGLIHLIEKITGKKANLDEATEKDWSPFGMPDDWYMNVEKAAKEGFTPPPMTAWLPELIQYFAR